MAQRQVNRWVRVTAALAAAMPIVTLAASTAAPSFTLSSQEGKPVSLEQFKGQVVMINFWASWCGPCRQEMPILESIYRKYQKLGFTLLGVNVEPDAKEAQGFLKKTPVSFPVLYDPESKVSALYKVAGMPSSVFIDRKGNLRVLHKGYKPGDENEYLNQIRSLLRE